jgi:hypothetical protein
LDIGLTDSFSVKLSTRDLPTLTWSPNYMLSVYKPCKPFISFISENRYILLVALILFKVGVQATNGIWYEDFWEHSAVVFALMQDSLTAAHPILDLSAPHSFVSPYHLFVAKFAQAFHLSSIDGLGFFGIINFCLFAYGINFYCNAFVNKETKFTNFYALLFILFLWGYRPWGFSGFFHFKLLADVLPYPSTFTTAISLIGLRLGFKSAQHKKIADLLLLILICTLVLLSHPLTFIFLASGLLSQSVTSQDKFVSTAQTVVLLTVASVIAIVWPYSSIITLLTGAANVYHASNQIMYRDVFIRVWPILALSPLLWRIAKDKAFQPTFLHLTALIAIYIFGWLTGKYSYGRDITFIAILIQILIASQFAYFENIFSQSHPNLVSTCRVSIGVILLCLASKWLYPTMTRSMTVLNSIVSGRIVSNQHTYKNLTFLPAHIKYGRSILSDIETSWLVPSFAGKVIGALHVQAFVADDELRRVDLIEFFASETSAAKRQSIIQKYKPDYFLIDKLAIKEWVKILNQVDSFSKTSKIFENDQYLLLRFD